MLRQPAFPCPVPSQAVKPSTSSEYIFDIYQNPSLSCVNECHTCFQRKHSWPFNHALDSLEWDSEFTFKGIWSSSLLLTWKECLCCWWWPTHSTHDLIVYANEVTQDGDLSNTEEPSMKLGGLGCEILLMQPFQCDEPLNTLDTSLDTWDIILAHRDPSEWLCISAGRLGSGSLETMGALHIDLADHALCSLQLALIRVLTQ